MSSEQLTTTADAVRIFRASMNLTQSELGELAGLRQETVCRIERGASPSALTVRKLAAAFGVDAAVLLPPLLKNEKTPRPGGASQ